MGTLENTLEQAEDALAHDDLDRAEAAFRSVLAVDPNHVLAREALREIALLRNSPVFDVVEPPPAVDLDRVVALAVPFSRLQEFSAGIAVLLSKLIPGPLAVGDLVDLADDPDEALGAVADCLARGVLA